MFINIASHYLPEDRVPNSFFGDIHDRDENWYVVRTGIHERSKAGEGETTHSMGVQAAANGLSRLPYSKDEIGLIVGGTYTPYDTIHTLGHAVQAHLDVSHIPVVTISSACSSMLNALEIVEGYFAMGKAEKALVVAAEHNTAYSNDDDPISGHLWGDGASALFLSKERLSESDFEIKQIITGGAGNVGKARDGVFLRPTTDGFQMPFGRDVFQHACNYMAQATLDILQSNQLKIEDLDYFIPHQANHRITRNVAEQLGLVEEKALSHIQYMGNTGCAGCAITFSENQQQFKKGEKIVFAVFGGGYSYGAMLIEV